MSKKKQKTYPDVSHLLAAHQAYRQKLAALSWEEKVAIIERMRDDLRGWHQPRPGDGKRGRRKSPTPGLIRTQ